MLQPKKILFPTDFSRCADQAMAYAVHLARRNNAELHLLHAIVLYNPADYFRDIQELCKRIQELSESHMDAAVKAHKAEDLNIVKVSTPAVSAGSMIIGYAAEYKTDLIIIGTHGRRGLGHFLLGSIAEEVVRSSPCPVLTVRELEAPKGPEKTERILAPVDFSEHSRRAALCAKQIAADYGARLQLLHVVEQPVYPSFYPFGESPDRAFPSLKEVEAKAKDEMRSMLKEGPDVQTDIQVIEGRAARDILKFAESNSTDLIVIATHGLSGFKHMLIGSTTEKVARQASCPVLTVK